MKQELPLAISDSTLELSVSVLHCTATATPRGFKTGVLDAFWRGENLGLGGGFCPGYITKSQSLDLNPAAKC